MRLPWLCPRAQRYRCQSAGLCCEMGAACICAPFLRRRLAGALPQVWRGAARPGEGPSGLISPGPRILN
eukprot:6213610-Pleurochrysis_carterae.AAC.1